MAKKTKKSNKYWKDRFLLLEESSNKIGMDTYRQIEPAFDKAQREIQNQINIWYSRVAKNNQITIEEAKKLLSAKELKEFHWDVEEYIKYGRENAMNQQWIKELENASARVHISRLEALKIRTQQAAEVAFGNELDQLDDMARKVYTEDYYRTIYEMQKGFNIGWEIGEVDQRKLDKLISKPWTADNKTFKDRIWTSKNQMISELHQQLTRTCMLGKSPDEAIEAMTKYVDKDIKNKKYAAGRLVMTEQAYFHSASQKDAFAELDVEKVEIVATLDSHTSQICQDMDGQIVDMKDYEPGVTVPPFHVFCRSVTVPYDEDFEDFKGNGQRAARGEDGKTYYIPDNMTYKEWKNNYVKSTPLEDIRTPVDIEFDASVSGYKRVEGGFNIRSNGEKYGVESKIVTLNKRNTTEWDELPSKTKSDLHWTAMDKKPFYLAKGDYEVQNYVKDSFEQLEREEIAKALDGEYVGFSFLRKNNNAFYVDFYQKGDDLFYSIGKADMQKIMKDSSFEMVEKVAAEREKLIIEKIGETNLKNISVRSGDEWVTSMKEFHRTIQADGKPSIISDAEYDAIKSPTLYRGIAPQSRLRSDITSTSTTKEMADEFFKGGSPFPSRGVYGDGVAYASPAYKKIAWNYATNYGQIPHGGVIIEFKLKTDAKIITYEDALAVFREMSKKGNSKLLFNPNQDRAFNKEVGKAMNSLGYDAILKHNGDNTGKDFYVILNRKALVAKEKYITTAL